ncbi:hypothetical protein BKA69DRAFT_1166408 [Paraphysoderma sedebokerense]|nr:hypothetical protein BKA69DRAFT_1166408 [Paraphysoderma sedebokerense]
MLPSSSKSIPPVGLRGTSPSNDTRSQCGPGDRLSRENAVTEEHGQAEPSYSINHVTHCHPCSDLGVASCGTGNLLTGAEHKEHPSPLDSDSSMSLQWTSAQWNSVWSFLSRRRSQTEEVSETTTISSGGSILLSQEPLSSESPIKMPSSLRQLSRDVASSSNYWTDISSVSPYLDQVGKASGNCCDAQPMAGLLSRLSLDERQSYLYRMSCGYMRHHSMTILTILSEEAVGMNFRLWDKEDFEDIIDDVPFLRDQLIVPLPSPEESLLFLNERGQFLMYIGDMSVVYLVGNTLEEGWRKFLHGSEGNWPLVLDRMDSETGSLLHDTIGLNVGSTCLVLTPSLYPTDSELMGHVEQSVKKMPHVSEKEIAIDGVKAALKKIDFRKYVCISLIITNTGRVEVSEV